VSKVKARLTDRAQGHNDIYWCATTERAIVVRNDQCTGCRKTLRPSDSWGPAHLGLGHQFLAHVHKGDAINEMEVLAETVKGVDDAEAEIDVLRDAINGFAQQVHQAYHGAHPPDLCDVNHLECPRGLCRSAQHVLSPKRPRGMP